MWSNGVYMNRKIATAFLLAATAVGQVTKYGLSTPANFTPTLTSRGQIPFAGNSSFQIGLRYTPNIFGSILAVSANSTNISLQFTTLYVDPTGILLFDLPSLVDTFPVAIPAVPGIAGLTAYAQAVVVDPIIPWGYGFTNGLSVTVLPDVTPRRAWIPGEDVSVAGTTVSALASLDLTTWPPSFRACGTLGSASTPFAPKIAVASLSGRAFAHGNGANSSIRIYDIAGDPVGISPWVMVDSIPLTLPVDPTPGKRDLAVNNAGSRLFATSGAGTAAATSQLDVFDVSQSPPVAMQSMSFPGTGGGCLALDLACTETRMALLIGSDLFPTLSLYSVSMTGSVPLTSIGAVPLPGFSGDPYPNDVQFSQDGSTVFVTGSNGGFAVVSVDTMTVVAAGTFALGPNGSGCAVAEAQGTAIGVLADVTSPGKFHIFDINPESNTFGSSLGTVTFPSTSLGCARLSGRQDMVVGVDTSAGFPACQFVEVVSFSSGLLTPNYARIQMPSVSSLSPTGNSARAHAFDLR